MTDRSGKRFPVMFRARLFWGDRSYPGVVSNVSEGGMHIRTKMSPPHDTVLEVMIKVGKGSMTFPSNVRWSVRGTNIYNSDGEHVMGVEFLDVPHGYRKLLHLISQDQPGKTS